MNKVNKNELKYIEEHFLNFDIENTLKKIEKTSTKQKIKEIFGEDSYFGATSDDQFWNHEAKKTLTSDVWRAIYKYSDEYGTYDHTQNYNNVFDEYSLNPNVKILDFGCGPNPLGFGSGDETYGFPYFINRCKCEFHLVELNDFSRQQIKKRFAEYSNVYVYENLSELFEKNLKFDVVHTKDCLEHVRYINEHLYLLYLLCLDKGVILYTFPYGTHEAGHVSTLYEDTILTEIMNKAFLQ